MRIFFFILVTSLFTSPLAAQDGYFSYQIIKGNREQGDTFPIFSHAIDSTVADKINTQLQLRFLEKLIGSNASEAFDQLKVDTSETYGSFFGNRYVHLQSVHKNDRSALSLRFRIELMSAMACTFWRCYSSYDATTGNELSLGDFFTDQGYLYFIKAADINM